MLLLRLLFIGLLALLVASQDDVQRPSADVLNNKHGQTPCEMRDLFPSDCGTSTAQARDNNDGGDDSTNFSRLTPTSCSCTNVYFNLWSACVFTTNSTLPFCSSFTQKCAQASFNITMVSPDADTAYPGWAFMELPPSNTTFDFAAAIETAKGSQPRKWTTIQIIVPILVGLAVAALIIVGLFIYCRRKNLDRQRPWMKTSGNRPRFQFPTMSSAHKVRELNRSTSWSIDEQEEDLDEYQFVSYPASLQGSQVSGHVRLSSSSSGSHLPGPPLLKIPAEKTTPVWTWPGKKIWKAPLQSAQQLGTSIPRPWRKRVTVKSVPSYMKFRVDAADSDSPLSRHPHAESLLGRAGRSRTTLHNETIFERENEHDSDSDEEALPLMPQEHSRSNHDAEPPANTVLLISPTAGESLSSSQRGARMPPATAPPSIPLPLPPPGPSTPPMTSAQQQPAVRPEQSSRPTPPLAPISLSSPQQSGPRTPRSHPAFPPAPTSPPPPPPTLPKRSPRAARSPLPAQFGNQPALPSPPLLFPPQPAPPPSSNIPPPPRPPPRRRSDSDGGSSVRSLPLTPTPLYVRATPAPIRVLDAPAGNTPPNSAPPYAPTVPPNLPPAHTIRSSEPSESARSVRRLPLPPS